MSAMTKRAGCKSTSAIGSGGKDNKAMTMTMTIDQIMERVSFSGEDVDALPYQELRKAVQEHMFVRVTGLFPKEEVLGIRRRLREQFDRGADRKHDSKDTKAMLGNLQKLRVGGDSADNCARFLRMFYNPIFADDIYGMRDIYVRLARFRNLLFELPRDFAVFGFEDGYWTASRINQYPTGGGFMVGHSDRDIYGEHAGEANPREDYHPLLLMTKKGVDFHEGGAYLQYDDGERIYYEDYCDVGDVLVYDGRLHHGVADVDPMKPLDLDTLNGRMAAFVSFYRKLT